MNDLWDQLDTELVACGFWSKAIKRYWGFCFVLSQNAHFGSIWHFAMRTLTWSSGDNHLGMNWGPWQQPLPPTASPAIAEKWSVTQWCLKSELPERLLLDFCFQFYFVCCFYEMGSLTAQGSLQITMWLRMTINSWSLCLYFQVLGIHGDTNSMDSWYTKIMWKQNFPVVWSYALLFHNLFICISLWG